VPGIDTDSFFSVGLVTFVLAIPQRQRSSRKRFRLTENKVYSSEKKGSIRLRLGLVPLFLPSRLLGRPNGSDLLAVLHVKIYITSSTSPPARPTARGDGNEAAVRRSSRRLVDVLPKPGAVKVSNKYGFVYFHPKFKNFLRFSVTSNL